MEKNYYEIELDQFDETIEKANSENIDDLKKAIQSSSELSIVATGSGGSYTVASMLCNLHETYTGRVSRLSTPLELICNPTLAVSSPVFLISAEGKNPDIIEALKRAKHHSSREIHILTNRKESLLIDCANELNEITRHVFELTKKDGYLATNSLLLDSILIARAYGGLSSSDVDIPKSIDKIKINSLPINDWINTASNFVDEIVKRRGVIVVYSPLLRPIAEDFESKLSEAALLHCQIADIRSFAHGRHLWLSERPDECAILSIVEPNLETLWEQMLSNVPKGIPTFTLSLKGSSPKDLISGLVSQMHLIAAIAKSLNKDPAKPSVQQFGRDLYYTDLTSAINAEKNEDFNHIEKSKLEVLGAQWPLINSSGIMTRAPELVLQQGVTYLLLVQVCQQSACF